MIISLSIAIYLFFTIQAFLKLGIGGGLAFVVFGIIIVALLPVFKKIRKQKAREMIKKGQEKFFININSAPHYVLEELPTINRVCAKKIVYIRNKYGKYKTVEDFFEKLNIKEEEQENLRRFLRA